MSIYNIGLSGLDSSGTNSKITGTKVVYIMLSRKAFSINEILKKKTGKRLARASTRNPCVLQE